MSLKAQFLCSYSQLCLVTSAFMSMPFGWVKWSLQKNSPSLFRYLRWKPHILHKGLFTCSLQSRCALGDALFADIRICAGSIFFTHMSMEGARELQEWASQGVTLTEQLQPLFKWEQMDMDNIVWIPLQHSQWTLSSLRLLAVFSNCFNLCFSIFPSIS